MKHLQLIVAVGLLLLSTGCVWTSQAVDIRPEIQVSSSSIGQGRQVYLGIADERPRSTLGTRGVRGVGANLTLKEDLVKTVENAVTGGLKRQGFNVISAKAAEGRELRIEIRNLDYSVTQGFWSGTLRVENGLKAICIIGLNRPYERLYRGEHEESIQVVQTEASNNEYVSKAVSLAINQLLQDERLMKCLSQ